jgi:hypothetical protein
LRKPRVSNKRKLKKPAGPDTRERCSVPRCGRRIGKLDDALRLRTGQVICPRCQQYGELARCPACNTAVLPGSFIVSNAGGNADVRCPACAPGEAVHAGNLRLGMAPRKAG